MVDFHCHVSFRGEYHTLHFQEGPPRMVPDNYIKMDKRYRLAIQFFSHSCPKGSVVNGAPMVWKSLFIYIYIHSELKVCNL